MDIFENMSGWWLTYPSEKYDFVSWDDEIPSQFFMGKSFKIPWFQMVPVTTNQMWIIVDPWSTTRENPHLSSLNVFWSFEINTWYQSTETWTKCPEGARQTHGDWLGNQTCGEYLENILKLMALVENIGFQVRIFLQVKSLQKHRRGC